MWQGKGKLMDVAVIDSSWHGKSNLEAASGDYYGA